MIYAEMSNQARIDWCYDNLEKESRNPGAPGRNVTKHGAFRIVSILGPAIFYGTYGQHDWEATYSLASDRVRAHREAA